MMLVYKLTDLITIVLVEVTFVLAAMSILTLVAARLKLVDLPNHRKHHVGPVPVVGGIAIYLAILLSLSVTTATQDLIWLMVSAIIILVAGILDDAIGLSVKTRVFAQLVATVVMICTTDILIQSLRVDWVFLDNLIGWSNPLITVIAVVGLTNAFNMIDGIDGLASGHALVCLVSLILIILVNGGVVYHYAWLVVLASPVFAFWLVNISLTPLGKIFLGDAGSMSLGFILAWTLIYYSQEPVSLVHPVMILWCVALPVWDTVSVVFKRLKKRQSPFLPDRNHIHHILIDMGIEQKIALGCMLVCAMLLNFIGFYVTTEFGALSSLATYIVLGVLTCVLAYFVGNAVKNKR